MIEENNYNAQMKYKEYTGGKKESYSLRKERDSPHNEELRRNLHQDVNRDSEFEVPGPEAAR